jgi:hypothetical protein
MVFRCGSMVPNTKGTGKITELMVEAASGTLMVICLKEISQTINPMVWVLTHVWTGLSTQGCGLMMFNMDKGRRVGLMAPLS